MAINNERDADVRTGAPMDAELHLTGLQLHVSAVVAPTRGLPRVGVRPLGHRPAGSSEF
jgi:hypothetical protein